MPYSALFAQSKSYFTHKVRGCQTFLQRIDKLFYINISPAFPLSSVPHLCFRSDRVIAAEPDIVPRRGFIRSPAPPEPLFYKRISPRRILPTISSTKHSCSYFFGFASAFSDRTVQPSLDHRHTESCPRYTLFPAQARKARLSPAPEFLFSEPLYARAWPPYAPFGQAAPCKHPHREPSAYLTQSLLPPYRTPILSQTYKNRSTAIKLNGEKQ